MKISPKLLLISGLTLDLIGLVIVVSSLPEGGWRLAAGAVCLVSGGVLVSRSFSRRADAEEQAPAPPRRSSGWRPEAELSAAPPRRTTLAPAGRVIAFVWLLMLIAAGFVAWDRVGPLNEPHPARSLLDAEGRTAQGAIHRKETRANAAGEPRYYLGYSFEDENGAETRSTVAVSSRLWMRYAEGDPLAVRHLPGDPAIHAATELERSPATVRGLLAGGTLLLACLVWMNFERRRHQRLVSSGSAVEGVVEAIRRRGAARRLTVRYSLEGASGVLRTTERNFRRSVGDSVTVLCDPQKPGDAVLYTAALYRAG